MSCFHHVFFFPRMALKVTHSQIGFVQVIQQPLYMGWIERRGMEQRDFSSIVCGCNG